MQCVFLDIETGGLNPKTDALLQIGIIVTNEKLEELACFSGIASTRQRGTVGEFARKMHEASGLLAECSAITTTPIALCTEAAAFLMGLDLGANVGPMFGSSVHFDRAFLNEYDPELVNLWSYRNVDVSSLKETCRLLGIPDPSESWPKVHTALEDIRRSIKEYDHYMRLMQEGWGESRWQGAAMDALKTWKGDRAASRAKTFKR